MRKSRRRRSGNIAVIFALCMTVILAIGSLTIDLGYARTTQQAAVRR
jgi:Flp pilus assembly protein TadG